MTTTKELIQYARNRIALPSNWCHGWANGNAVCIVHALHDGMTQEDWYRGSVYNDAIALVAAEADCNEAGLGWKNDAATHEQVIGWLDRAILKCDETVTGT